MSRSKAMAAAGGGGGSGARARRGGPGAGVIAATVVGNVLEWYDFGCFAAYADEIKVNFFPKTEDGVTEMLSQFGVYAAAFLMRPVGGIILGYVGDKFGRVVSLGISVTGMGVTAVLMAVLPSFDYAPGYSIGITATILMTIVRLVQGLSIGGELIGSLIYSNETSDSRNRMLLTVLPFASSGGGIALGYLIAAILTHVLSPAQQNLFGWRIGFALGSPIAVLAVVARSKLQESEAFNEEKLKSSEQVEKGEEVRGIFREAVCRHGVSILLVFLVTGLFATGLWMADAWLTVYVTQIISNPLSKTDALYINMACILLNVATILAVAALIDRFLAGSRRGLFWVMASSGSVSMVSAPFLLMGVSRGTDDLAGLVLSQMAWTVLIATYSAPLTSWMIGRFPVRVRYVGLATAYNLSQAIFGGPAELLLSAIATSSALLEAPALYFSAVAAVSVAGLLISEFVPCAQVPRVPHSKGDPDNLNPESSRRPSLRSNG